VNHHRLSSVALLLFVFPLLTSASDSHVQVSLWSTQASIERNKPFDLAIHLTMSDHWHTYWENPGSSGLPTEIVWEPMADVDITPLRFPFPKAFVDEAGFITFGFDDTATLLATAVYRGNASQLTLKGTVSWLECKEICLPGSAQVSLTLDVGATKASDQAAQIEKARGRLPKAYDEATPFDLTDTQVDLSPDQWQVQFTLEGSVPEDLAFFPCLTPQGEFKSFDKKTSNGTLHATVIFDVYEPVSEADFSLCGVLAGSWEGKKQAFRVPIYPRLTEKPLLGDDRPPLRSVQPQSPGAGSSLEWILFLALIGGIILNLMPCVLPVLSLKIFKILQEAGESHTKRILHGWVYALGILVSFAILSFFLIAAKAAGQQLGIGFQFQNPSFVIAMVVLIFLMALSFLGVFLMEAPNQQKLQSLAEKKGLMGSFFNGALMTILSTPCTAPGLGAAYGWAVSQPGWVIFLIFQVIGFGLATPYLILCYSPALLKFLPKPGLWMETFKVSMGFILMATVIWLLHVLMQLTGSSGMVGTLTLLLFLSAAAWIHGQTFFTEARSKGLLINLVLVAVGIYVGLFLLFDLRRPFDAKREAEETLRLTLMASLQGEPSTGTSYLKTLEDLKTTADRIAWVPYSDAALNHFRDMGRLVFLDFTADWCATCKVNETLVINTRPIREALAESQVVTMKVDYTKEDPAITAFIHSFQRAGVPLYVFYPGKGDPILLPETITQGIFLDGLTQARKALP
jgi:thiol:disulfide interchange protein DsbD